MSPITTPDLAPPGRILAGPVRPEDAPPALPVRHVPRPSRTEQGRHFIMSVLVLAFLWAVLTDWRLDAWVFGAPAVLAGAALGLILPQSPRLRLSWRGALAFALWFAVQSVRGAVDVAGRAFSPSMPLRPGFRTYPLVLPAGAPRVFFVNAISLLPGTLSAEIRGGNVVVHMLDTRADLEAELAVLEARVAALFALRQNMEMTDD